MSNSPQYIRTDKAIVRALISLLKVKPFEKITIQDILDETPVTRATFYAHFRDKYEIAEKMQDHFLAAHSKARKVLGANSLPTHSSVEAFVRNNHLDQDFIQALMKIHTEKVDIRSMLARQLEEEYLSETNSPTRQMEARIYAQANVELYFSIIETDSPDYSPSRNYQCLIAVALKLLRLDSDPDAAKFLMARVAQSL